MFLSPCNSDFTTSFICQAWQTMIHPSTSCILCQIYYDSFPAYFQSRFHFSHRFCKWATVLVTNASPWGSTPDNRRELTVFLAELWHPYNQSLWHAAEERCFALWLIYSQLKTDRRDTGSHSSPDLHLTGSHIHLHVPIGEDNPRNHLPTAKGTLGEVWPQDKDVCGNMNIKHAQSKPWGRESCRMFLTNGGSANECLD